MTYTRAYQLKAIKDITKNDILLLCDYLNTNFEGITFKPEGITEGGIVYHTNIPRYYKSFRLDIRNDVGKWPWIRDDVMDEWRSNNDIIIYKGKVIDPFLKAFYDAPSYTHQELEIWEIGLEQIGLIVKGKYPAKKWLKERIN
jgi:hypothetical protein